MSMNIHIGSERGSKDKKALCSINMIFHSLLLKLSYNIYV